MSASIYTYTVIRFAPDDFAAQAPYVCAVVEAEDGIRSLQRLQGYCPDMKIAVGMRVTKETSSEGVQYRLEN